MKDRSVYPKVKVKEQNDQDDPKGTSLFPLDDDSYFPEHKDFSPLCVAKIPISYVPNAPPMQTISESQEVGKHDKKLDKDDEINNRASSILRPRAILSSPDNDVPIGNKNMSKVKQPSALMNSNLVQSRHMRRKAISSSITESPFNTRISKDADDGKSDLRRKKGLGLSASNQKKYLGTVKPSSMGT